MKINEKNLCAFASSATPVDREGWLEMRLDITKSYQNRWFVLKGNLLFYYDKQGDKEPFGVIILEGCTIELTEEEEAYSFKIVFQCEGGRTYYLCTNSQASMEAWMKALACASYDYMNLMVAELQRQLEEAEAENASEASTSVNENTEVKPPPRGQRHNPFNKLTENEGKAVQGSRHYKEFHRADSVPRKKFNFREIHSSYGRKILLDRNEWRVKLLKLKDDEKRKNEISDVPLIEL